MSMTNAKDAKQELEADIVAQLKKFEADHGLIVTNVQGTPKFERDENNEQITNWAGRLNIRCQF